ncbi:MAG: hypothetical protein ACC653_11400 [Gammaproteobacteria bacterium]
MIKQILLLSAVMLSLVSCGGGGGGAATDPATTGDFTLSTTQLSFTADVAAGTPASQNITGTLKNELPNVTVQAVVVSNVNILASIPTFTSTGTKSGFLTINPISPGILGAGTFNATISIYICSVITNDCVNSNSQIAGSPKVVNVTYTVTNNNATFPALKGSYYGSIESTYNNCVAEGMSQGSVVSSSGILTISQTGKDWTSTSNFTASANSNLSATKNIWIEANTISDGIIDTAGNIQGTMTSTITSGGTSLISGNASFMGSRSLTGDKLTINSTLTVPGSTCQKVTRIIARVRATAPLYTADTNNTGCIENPTLDATKNAGVVKLKKSHSTGIYGRLTSRNLSDGTPIEIDYMVHTNTGNEKALVVLIPGGNGDARLPDTTTIGMAPADSSGNFLIRSAKLFAAQGYRVISVDRPFDQAEAPGATKIPGTVYDAYRVSMLHAVDLSRIINAENPNNLPVIIAGTSRGTISAVPNHSLASAIALSSPLTSKPAGAIGTPIGLSDSPANLQPGYVNRPVQVSWHSDDGCSVTPPIRALTLSDKFLLADNKVKADSINGGFTDPATTNPCKGKAYHGFLGIESCAVSRQTNWMADVVTGLAGNTRPITIAHTFSTPLVAGSASTIINLAAITAPAVLVTDADVTDTHQYSVPYATTVLGGSITITAAGVATYTPPAMVTVNTKDHFVYVVDDYDATGNTAKGGTANNVFTIDITPAP